MATSTTSRARLVSTLLGAGLALAACSVGTENVSCSPRSCSVTLSGSGTEAEILGTTLAFAGVEDGRATLSVGDARVSCAEGESVTAGPLQLECSSVTDDSVELTASLG